MPIPAQTGALTHDDSAVDQQSYGAQNTEPMMPSETTQPTQVPDVSQQGATMPGSGSTVTAGPTFKEKVVGYAKEIRGTTLGKPETKEQGQRIVNGEEKFETKKVGSKAKIAEREAEQA
ncbi:hypothetical protein BC835DRAFT_1414378 [Cytidiella melzeri]|nr:hypothetical protein BC835DRAFT_1414378 [Cytidiella melzeri]